MRNNDKIKSEKLNFLLILMYKKTLLFLIEILKNGIFSSPREARRRKISQTNFLKIIIKKYIFLHFLIIFSLFPFQKGNAFLDGDF